MIDVRSFQYKISENNVNVPTFAFDDSKPWQMSRWERYTLDAVLSNLKPKVSIEIGTYKGGSLSILSKYSEKAFSIDVDKNVQERLSGLYDNVEFVCGKSADCICDVLNNLNAQGPNFILVDGDHSKEGVYNDLKEILSCKNNSKTLILMHDSFNPECRAGIIMAPWSENERVSFVDVDFVPGSLHENGFDQASPMSMWGGFACALLLPEKRNNDLCVQQSQKAMYQAVLQRLETDLN